MKFGVLSMNIYSKLVYLSMNYLRGEVILIKVQASHIRADVHRFPPGEISIINRFHLHVVPQRNYNTYYSKMSGILALIFTN